MKNKSALISLILMIIPIFGLSAANILVPSLELVTYGFLQNSTFKLRTRGDIDFKIEGGFKFGGSIMLGFQSDNLEDLAQENTDTLTFRSTSVVIRELFNLPLNVTYFSGIMDTFGNGQVFRDFFGVEPFSSKYKGYVYFPNGVVYDGIHTIQGTGFMVETASLWDSLVLSLYLYQDGYLGQGKYSIDARSLLNYPNFKMEAFLGTTLGATSLGLYRGGVLLYFKAGETGEFLTQVGIPRWDPAQAFNISLFYFLFEPRVNFGNFSIIMTLFWHPQYYLQAETNELGSIDINVDFRFGDPNVNRSTGGIENNLVFSTAVNPGEGQFKATFSPYLSVVTSGVIWDFKVKVKAFPFSLTDLVETFVGVRAEF